MYIVSTPNECKHVSILDLAWMNREHGQKKLSGFFLGIGTLVSQWLRRPSSCSLCLPRYKIKIFISENLPSSRHCCCSLLFNWDSFLFMGQFRTSGTCTSNAIYFTIYEPGTLKRRTRGEFLFSILNCPTFDLARNSSKNVYWFVSRSAQRLVKIEARPTLPRHRYLQSTTCSLSPYQKQQAI